MSLSRQTLQRQWATEGTTLQESPGHRSSPLNQVKPVAISGMALVSPYTWYNRPPINRASDWSLLGWIIRNSPLFWIEYIINIYKHIKP